MQAAPDLCAIYFAPDPNSPWGQAGSQWLGRCAATKRHPPLPRIEELAPDVQTALTADPRRYGWHATLKAPFALAPGQDIQAVLAAMQRLAGEFSAFDLPPLGVDRRGHFLALRPMGDCAPLQAVAAACVTRLQPLALPLGESELARRRRAPLTPEQDALLCQWGYPWVLNHFHFHFSLSNTLEGVDPSLRVALADAASEHFASLGPCRFDRLALFVEPEKGADFQLAEFVPLQP
ncbi:MAG: DUF1045 domain-containing protein [Ramlibacter sp.]|uniref:DUF1045 domain-containing protein n=1 Tax=Ramlibacter sp. TaxID=1917967 RepID=UPI0026024A21|nr:DUF1045 domain-containing protein [Ramlibacter sp.]MDH4376511.1 DUF1045 domain-containing protein [Ramlibacter sp.]